MLERIKKHPIVVLISTIVVVVIALLTLLQGLTGDALLPFLNKNGWILDMPPWYSSSVIVLGCAVLVLQGSVIRAFSQLRKANRNNLAPEKTEPTPLPQPKQAATTTPSISRPTFTLTGAQATDLITTIQSLKKIVSIKIVSIPEHWQFAKDLENALRAAGCTFILDKERNETVFLARSLHGQNRIVLRYHNYKNSPHYLTYFTITGVFKSMFPLQQGLSALFTPIDPIEVNEFSPETSEDYFQIEIGGAP